MTQAEETMVLVDAGDTPTGLAGKMQTHREGSLHRAFSVIVWDGAGRMLLQKRASQKYHSAGLWTNSCCGHPGLDEEVVGAAARRLREEMGFSCPLVPLGKITYRAELDHGMIEHELVHIFQGNYAGAIAADPAEVQDHRWITPAALRAELAEDPGAFTAWFKHYADAGWPIEPPASDG